MSNWKIELKKLTVKFEILLGQQSLFLGRTVKSEITFNFLMENVNSRVLEK